MVRMHAAMMCSLRNHLYDYTCLQPCVCVIPDPEKSGCVTACRELYHHVQSSVCSLRDAHVMPVHLEQVGRVWHCVLATSPILHYVA